MQRAAGTPLNSFFGQGIGTITALFLIGAAPGGLRFGWLSGKVGRVRAMSLAILCYTLFTLVSDFALAPLQLGLLRFVAALGMGGEWSLGVALVMEVWPEKLWPLLDGVIGAAANVGFAIVGLIGIALPVTQDSWRWIMFVGAAPGLRRFFVRLFVPESPRWLETLQAGPMKPLREILSPLLLRSSVLATQFASIALICSWGSLQWLIPWTDQRAPSSVPPAKAYTQTLAAVGSLGSGAWIFRGFDQFGVEFLWMTFLVGASTVAVPIGALMNSFDGSYARAGAIITLVYAVGLLVIGLAPETKGCPFPE